MKPLIETGAEVIIPAGGLPMLLFARESPFVIDDAPVLNGIAIVAKATEMAISLRSITNVVVSRRGTYAKAPPAAIASSRRGCARTRARPRPRRHRRFRQQTLPSARRPIRASPLRSLPAIAPPSMPWRASSASPAALSTGVRDLDRVLGEGDHDVLVHAAGPFQGQDYAVAELCIRHGVHYLDLADDAAFVRGIDRLPMRR